MVFGREVSLSVDSLFVGIELVAFRFLSVTLGGVGWRSLAFSGNLGPGKCVPERDFELDYCRLPGLDTICAWGIIWSFQLYFSDVLVKLDLSVYGFGCPVDAFDEPRLWMLN